MAKRWTLGEVELLKRHFPNYKALVGLLRRNKNAIQLKAAGLGLSNIKSSRKEKRPKVFLPKETVTVRTKHPSYKEMLLKAEEEEKIALIALHRAEGIGEWARCLDEYRYWTIRREQLMSNKWLHKATQKTIK
jgi:hypothetical protein